MRTSSAKIVAVIALTFLIFNMIPHKVTYASKKEIVYPLKTISKLECRFEDYDTLSSKCKESLPILKTKDYKKYAAKNGGYNDYTRLYTVLWGASYKYGWDVGNGGHQWTDIATAKGTPIYSMADGVVIAAWSDAGWGNYVSIEHKINGKKVISNYAHMSKKIVKNGEKVNVWEKIGEVGSTGNSTGNHLHFQIDLPNKFHPYYYDWNACPYSYYKITEEGVCFDELSKNTIDPLAFLESNGAILDEIKITDWKNYSSSNTVKTSSTQTNIFNTTVYYGYGSKDDIKSVQRIYKDLWYYKWSINWNFSDLESSIIDYQVERNVIDSRTADGAGWFGPKTRAQTKKDYDKLDKNEKSNNTKKVVGADKNSSVTQVQKVEKIEKKDLMTREEREAQEMSDFLDVYNTDVKWAFTQMKVGETKQAMFSITNKKGKWYKWNTPGIINFKYDESKINIFPKSFYNFKDGIREIKVTGLKDGHTTVEVRIWEVIIKNLSISVWAKGKSGSVKSAHIVTDRSAVLWEVKKAAVVMRDQYSNSLIKSKYTGKFTIKSDNNILYCLKKWRVQDIKEIYKRNCYNEEYQSEIVFSYEDTFDGIVLFDYKILDSNGEIKIAQWNSNLLEKKISVKWVKNLASNYEYYNSVLNGLMKGTVDWIDRWYFMQDKELSELDAKNWLLASMRQSWKSDEEIQKLKYEPASKYTKVTRWEFLELVDEYLGNEMRSGEKREYKDLDENGQIAVATLLWTNYEWKDNFWERYFQPEKKITRWEAAYMLTETVRYMWDNAYVVSK